jgi:hypothetical protein
LDPTLAQCNHPYNYHKLNRSNDETRRKRQTPNAVRGVFVAVDRKYPLSTQPSKFVTEKRYQMDLDLYARELTVWNFGRDTSKTASFLSLVVCHSHVYINSNEIPVRTYPKKEWSPIAVETPSCSILLI